MESALNWMTRDNPHYDPNRIGAISQAKILSALTAAGKIVLAPCMEVRPYDFVIEEKNGSFSRIQCKTGRLLGGAIRFRPHRLRAAKRETGWQRRVTDYNGDVDFFAIYCPENDLVYLMPIELVTTPYMCSLRVSPTRNNQTKKIRWAKDYLVAPQPIPMLTSIDFLLDN